MLMFKNFVLSSVPLFRKAQQKITPVAFIETLPEAYLEPRQTSMMKLFLRKLHYIYITGF